jgi:hydrogenase/urease accessory protein HupE
MPQNRNRPGHPHHKQAAIPAKQRVKGRIFAAILFAVFGVLIAFFAAGNNYVVLGIVAIMSAVIGYAVGKAMEQDVSRRS